MSATAALTFSPTATLSGAGSMSATTTLTLSFSGTATGSGAVEASATISFAPSGTISESESDATVFVEGLEATGALGTVTVTTSGDETPFVLTLLGKLVRPGRRKSVKIRVVGLEAIGALGTVTVMTGSSVTVQGAAARASINRCTVRCGAVILARGQAVTIAPARARVQAIQNPTEEALVLLALDL